ncbi:MAG: hypothetical protein JNL64_07450 [Blastocatellia bacterium]|nr:hypothetical protein [Blastocatellia bacterium]
MKGSRIIAYILTTIILSAFVSAQTPTEPMSGDTTLALSNTEQVDEFGKAGDCEFSTRVDNLVIRLNAQADSTAYVITYLGANALPGEVLHDPMKSRILRYLAIQKYDTSRIVFIEGGYRETLSTEFWIVPLGAAPPKPSNTVLKPAVSKHKTILWAKSFVYTEEDSMSEFELPEVQARLDEENRLAALALQEEDAESSSEIGSTDTSSETIESDPVTVDEESEDSLTPEQIKELRFNWVNLSFGSAIAERKNSKGVIIFYADDKTYDIAKLQNFIAEAVTLISEEGNIRSDRIQVVFGGFRDNIQAEFWIVPANSELPIPKPDERPTQDRETNSDSSSN